jgi:predicted RNA-binding Zn-ribbon protein involved in translation (DUF1610 family)
MIVTISEAEAADMMMGMGNPGVCLSCGMVDEYAGCEPDARNYTCPDCGEGQLFGLEEALMMGCLEIV